MEPVDLETAISELVSTFPGLPNDYVTWLASGAAGRSRRVAWRGQTLDLVLCSAFDLQKLAHYGTFGPQDGMLRIGAELLGEIYLRLGDGAIVYYDETLSASGGEGLPDPADAVVLCSSFGDLFDNIAPAV